MEILNLLNSVKASGLNRINRFDFHYLFFKDIEVTLAALKHVNYFIGDIQVERKMPKESLMVQPLFMEFSFMRENDLIVPLLTEFISFNELLCINDANLLWPRIRNVINASKDIVSILIDLGCDINFRSKTIPSICKLIIEKMFICNQYIQSDRYRIYFVYLSELLEHILLMPSLNLGKQFEEGFMHHLLLETHLSVELYQNYPSMIFQRILDLFINAGADVSFNADDANFDYLFYLVNCYGGTEILKKLYLNGFEFPVDLEEVVTQNHFDGKGYWVEFVNWWNRKKPRSLKHLARIAVRKKLLKSNQINISPLSLPQSLAIFVTTNSLFD